MLYIVVPFLQNAQNRCIPRVRNSSSARECGMCTMCYLWQWVGREGIKSQRHRPWTSTDQSLMRMGFLFGG
jgi:hypothetical protein